MRATTVVSHLFAVIILQGLLGGITTFAASVNAMGAAAMAPSSSLPKIWHWIPDGTPVWPNPPTCSARTLEQDIAQNLSVQKYFDRCGRVLSRWAPTKLTALVEMMSVDYHIEDLKGLQEAVFHLPDSTVIRGLLWLVDKRPRPLIVGICGTACDTYDEQGRQLLMMLHDATPFNVLILPSITSSYFIRANQRIDVGGLEEGQIVYNVVRDVVSSSSILRPFISSVHILGASLGGQSALYASLYASLNPLPANGPQIQSIFAYCPAVNLHETVQRLDQKTDFAGSYYRRLIYHKLQEFHDLVNFNIPDPQPGHTADTITQAVLPLYRQRAARPSPSFLAPFSDLRVTTAEQFWDAQRFTDYYQDDKLPTFLFASDDDPVVDIKLNSLYLDHLLDQNRAGAPIHVVHVPRGMHCSSQMIYGWDVFSSLIRSYILKYAPEFTENERPKTYQLDAVFPPLEAGQKYFGVKWTANQRRLSADLDIHIWAPTTILDGGEPCEIFDPFSAPVGCFRDAHLSIPLQLFSKAPAQNKTEAQVLTRWLNGRVWVSDQSLNEIVNSTHAPARLDWYPD